MIVNAETPKMEAKYWAKCSPITHMLEKMGVYAKIGCFPSKLYTPAGNAKHYFKKELFGIFKLAGFDRVGAEQSAQLPLFLLPLIPSWLLDPLLKLEVNAKRGLLGSKIMVVGDKL